MNWELRADPGRAPGERNIAARGKKNSIWPSIAVVAAAAAFGGVIWFAYQNGRDAGRGGLPPLVKAEPGPVKVKPDNPGGQEIPFQDSTVYDRLGQSNGQKPVTEKLLPPPEAPVTRPPPETASVVPPAAAPPPAASQAVAAPPVLQPVLPPQGAVPGPNDGSPTVLAPTLGGIITQPPATRTAPVAPKPAPVPQKGAPQPQAQPAPKAAADPIAALIASEAGTAPAKAAGGYRLRLSAVRSADAVEPEWARLKRLYPELAPLKSAFSKVDVAGKGVFYRVEAGPLDEAAAKSACEHLRNQGLGCVVVKP